MFDERNEEGRSGKDPASLGAVEPLQGEKSKPLTLCFGDQKPEFEPISAI